MFGAFYDSTYTSFALIRVILAKCKTYADQLSIDTKIDLCNHTYNSIGEYLQGEM